MSNVISVIELDVIVKEVSCFKSFKSLINAKGNYRPTIRIDVLGRKGRILRDAYNKSQEKRDDPRRAYCG